MNQLKLKMEDNERSNESVIDEVKTQKDFD